MRLRPVFNVFAAFGIALGAHAQAVDSSGMIQVEPEVQPAVPGAKGARHAAPRARHAKRVELDAPSPTELAQVEPANKRGLPPRIGFGRPLASLFGDDSTRRALEWEALDDGSQVAAISVTSPGAAALRLGVRINDLPADAVFRFHDEDREELHEVSGAQVLALLAANAAAGEHGPDARTFWSPIIESSTIVMEIQLPPGVAASKLRISAPVLSHLVASAKDDFMTAKAAASCNRDAMCEASTWSTQMNAVARIAFSSGGSTFVCSGTLMADTDTTTSIPYFLTANHCIDSQSAASSLVTYWFYRSSACNSATTGPYVRQPGGAQLLSHSTATDVSLLRLNTTPPAGATYAGWRAGSAVPLSSAVTGLHHPTGDLLKISSGRVLGYLTCSPPSTDGQFSCRSVTSPSGATFYDVAWSSGVVEPGSSGSAIFDSGKYVVGQLYGGGSSCDDPTAGDSYGRFDVSYASGLSQWLNAPPPVMHALGIARAGSGAGYVSSTPARIDCGDACSATFAQGSTVTLNAVPDPGSIFTGWGGVCIGTGACVIAMNAPVSVTANFTARIAGTLSASPQTLAFGATQAVQVVTVTNGGGANTTITGVSVSSPRYGVSNGCGVLVPGDSCTVAVTYYPSASGPLDAVLTLTSTAANSPHVVALNATAGGTASDARLTGISTRMNVAGGNDVMIGGFVVGGTGVKTVVVRARGPSLAANGVANPLANPMLQLVRAADRLVIASNDDWTTGDFASAIANNGYAPSDARESALLATLQPGAYTAIVSGVGGTSGVAIVEAFEVDNPAVPLAGLSTRGAVLTGNEVMIGGFVIQGTTPQTVVVRARGPSLVTAGIANALANPTLTLVRAADNLAIATNDDWGGAGNAAALAASGFAPSHPQEAAILMTLEPGAYTAILSGLGNTSGVGIVEVYPVP